MTPRRARSGATVIELVIVIGVIGILIGLLLPAVQQVRTAAQRTACQNTLRQVGVAAHGYHAQHGRLPPAGVDRTTAFHWYVSLLPHLDRDDLWRTALAALDVDPIPFHNPPHTPMAAVVKPLVCPADGRLAGPQVGAGRLTATFTSYLGVSGGRYAFDGVFGRLPGVRLTDIADGASQTLFAGERPPPDSWSAGWWYSRYLPPTNAADEIPLPSGAMAAVSAAYPGEPCVGPFVFGPGVTGNSCDRLHFWSLHGGGGNWLFADGAVRWFAYAARDRLPALGTINGGEPTSDLD